jgi:hypothetical protein
LKWFGTLRARFGYVATQRLLGYVDVNFGNSYDIVRAGVNFRY